jgi:hypothetical protein
MKAAKMANSYTLVENKGVWVLTGGSLKSPRRFLAREEAIEFARNDCKTDGGVLREVSDGNGLSAIEFKPGQ